MGPVVESLARFGIESLAAVGGFVISIVGDTGSLGVDLIQAVAHLLGAP